VDSDELEPRRRQANPLELDRMGLEELEDHLAALEEEARQVREVLASKTQHRGMAESLFKK